MPGLQFYLRGVFRLQCTGGLIDKTSMTCRQHRIDVVEALKKTNNTLVITIKPAAAEAKRRVEAYPYSVPFVQVLPIRRAHVTARGCKNHCGYLPAGLLNFQLLQQPNIIATRHLTVS